MRSLYSDSDILVSIEEKVNYLATLGTGAKLPKNPRIGNLNFVIFFASDQIKEEIEQPLVLVF